MPIALLIASSGVGTATTGMDGDRGQSSPGVSDTSPRRNLPKSREIWASRKRLETTPFYRENRESPSVANMPILPYESPALTAELRAHFGRFLRKNRGFSLPAKLAKNAFDTRSDTP
jgi:hypothetical protein